MKLKIFLIALLILIASTIQSAKAIFESNTYKNGNEIFYKKFDTVNESVNLGTILDDDRIAVVGKGEIAITIQQ
ncbi:hypothetical protein [Clostridium beijerinckii]|uniref:hypothetical protein n=1 Tax=Clostridium beijerinckii TaxID=1520 RepID=UPI0022E2251B|nr:hypothetical protein [Clostridium beijerinckii]